MAWLKSAWQELLVPFAADAVVSDAVFASLVNAYSEKGRFYHNLSHVKTLLGLAQEVEHLLSNAVAVAFAIWFHDAIYQPSRSDNEERSAQLAAQSLAQLTVADEMIAYVQRMIRATARHDADGLPTDGRIFLDLDLSILAAAPETYQAYRRAIRKEFSWVPEFLYRRERRKILQRFVEREAIYFTAPLAALYEAQARRNLAAEIKQLSG